MVGIWLLLLTLPAAASPSSTDRLCHAHPACRWTHPVRRPAERYLHPVALLHKITLDQLRALNNIRGTDCVVQLGQELLIGYAGPSESPTPGPSPTATPLLPTSTPLPGKASVCVVLFEDINGNGLLDDVEAGLLGGAVSITNRSGSFSKTGTTVSDPTAPLCFEDVTEGEYSISLAVPAGL